jgi:hypothetical protein
VNTSGRNEANSKTAGCRFDSCPTCPRMLNSWGLLLRALSRKCVLCPSVPLTRDHQEQHRRSLSAAKFVIDFPARYWAPVPKP